ncbi:hypothetical protein [Actinoplanes sp. NPDC051851]|uniref:hypothetical protein n=1 Tax=Actinoplanes sp. NPDC051851 TaxID=3154753 RepID=UPI0034422610
MADGDWEPDEEDRKWLPDFDVRAAVGALSPGPVALDDIVWAGALPDLGALAEIRDAIRGLRAEDLGAAQRSYVRLRWLVCGDGETSVFGAGVVSSLGPARRDR